VAGSAKAGPAADASAALKGMDFTIVAPPTDGSVVAPATPPKRTTIRYPEGSQRMALELARHLTAGAEVVDDKTIHDFTMVITIGADYAGTTAAARPLDEATALPTSTTLATGSTASAAGAKAGAAAKAPVPTSVAPGGSPSSTGSSTTSSTEQVLGGGPDAAQVGVVPGKPPAGVSCG
jgi:hypothetical protein